MSGYYQTDTLADGEHLLRLNAYLKADAALEETQLHYAAWVIGSKDETLSTEVFRCWWDPASFNQNMQLDHTHDEDGDGHGIDHSHVNDGDHSHEESAPEESAPLNGVEDSVLDYWDDDLEDSTHMGNDGREDTNLGGDNNTEITESEITTSPQKPPTTENSWDYESLLDVEPSNAPGGGRRLDHEEEDYCWSAHSESQLEYMQ